MIYTAEKMTVVSTRFGPCRLDEASLKAFRRGRLWICDNWRRPTYTVEAEPPLPLLPPSPEALRRSAEAEVQEPASLVPQLSGPDGVSAFLPRLDAVPVGELCLSVRSMNCLMRAGIRSFGALEQKIRSETGLTGLRNLGATSEREILHTFFNACYERLSPAERLALWDRAAECGGAASEKEGGTGRRRRAGKAQTV